MRIPKVSSSQFWSLSGRFWLFSVESEFPFSSVCFVFSYYFKCGSDRGCGYLEWSLSLQTPRVDVVERSRVLVASVVDTDTAIERAATWRCADLTGILSAYI